MMTGAGMILGTAAYMAPEQAKGREADKRSDIWAFGCVLFEMLTARRPFDGEDIDGRPRRGRPPRAPWEALPADVPTPVRTLLRQCLVKDRRRRVGDIAAVPVRPRSSGSSRSGSGRSVAIDSRRMAGRSAAGNRVDWRCTRLAASNPDRSRPSPISSGSRSRRPRTRPSEGRALEAQATTHNWRSLPMAATSSTLPVPSPCSTSGCDRSVAPRRVNFKEPRVPGFRSGHPTASPSRSSRGTS